MLNPSETVFIVSTGENIIAGPIVVVIAEFKEVPRARCTSVPRGAKVEYVDIGLILPSELNGDSRSSVISRKAEYLLYKYEYKRKKRGVRVVFGDSRHYIVNRGGVEYMKDYQKDKEMMACWITARWFMEINRRSLMLKVYSKLYDYYEWHKNYGKDGERHRRIILENGPCEAHHLDKLRDLGRYWVKSIKKGEGWAVEKNWLNEEPEWWWKVTREPFLPELSKRDWAEIKEGRSKYLVKRWKRLYPLFSKQYGDYLEDLARINN